MASVVKVRPRQGVYTSHKHRITKARIMKTRMTENKLPDEATQVRESLTNLQSGNYKDFPIEEYLKEIKE